MLTQIQQGRIALVGYALVILAVIGAVDCYPQLVAGVFLPLFGILVLAVIGMDMVRLHLLLSAPDFRLSTFDFGYQLFNAGVLLALWASFARSPR